MFKIKHFKLKDFLRKLCSGERYVCEQCNKKHLITKYQQFKNFCSKDCYKMHWNHKENVRIFNRRRVL